MQQFRPCCKISTNMSIEKFPTCHVAGDCFADSLYIWSSLTRLTQDESHRPEDYRPIQLVLRQQDCFSSAQILAHDESEFGGRLL